MNLESPPLYPKPDRSLLYKPQLLTPDSLNPKIRHAALFKHAVAHSNGVTTVIYEKGILLPLYPWLLQSVPEGAGSFSTATQGTDGVELAEGTATERAMLVADGAVAGTAH